MKVSEAKTKICPFMTRGENSQHYVYCKCEKCMAWICLKTKELEENEKCGYCEMIKK